MEWIAYVVASLFVLFGAACLFSIIFQVPGGWVMFGAAALIEFLDRYYLPEDDRQTFAWWVLGVTLGLLIVGEILEFIAGALGAKTGGGTRRGMIGALIGGIAGALVLTPFLWFIPIIGSLVGAIIGTFIGALVGEVTAEKGTWGGSVRPAAGATMGRVLGTFGKMGVSVVAWIVLSASAFLM